MGVDSILGYNLSVQTKNFTKRITLGATGANLIFGLLELEIFLFEQINYILI